ncbi:hypothetical protein VT84_02640 [Gemmata sp. SH-PL17]|uniref:hypothetical protein n=1 Tax=Gemmata sp. SH-PL17 TaxID=1630693 RepID=UPI0004B12D9C|nr:hypothetical protein [Gemmata sp. SH-PL17]AMV23278.1 hypothetical protein VT84_02640 [Gemmata sp. SH-PL17]
MTTTKSAADVLYRLLYRALIEIREQGWDTGNKAVFHLADLFHTTALELGQVAAGSESHEAVLRHLEEKAAEKGVTRWLQNALSEIDTQTATPTN